MKKLFGLFYKNLFLTNRLFTGLGCCVVLFVLGLGSHYVNKANWGSDWHSFAPFGVGGIGLAAGLVFFSPLFSLLPSRN